MNEINKDELLDLKKWQRLFFMVIYGMAINFVVSILIFLVAIQFIFYLFTSKTNNQLQSANNWLQEFFNDSLNFLSFNTNSKPWPFNDKNEESDLSDLNEEIDTLGGFIISIAGRVPVKSEVISYSPSGLKFEILEADPRKIILVKIIGLNNMTPLDKSKL